MVSQLPSEERIIVRSEVHSDKGEEVIDAVCINCNKRFKSIRAVSMHLKMTGGRHATNIINHGIYNKKTGLREMNRVEPDFKIRHETPVIKEPIDLLVSP